MTLDPDHVLMFLHIPKTAGSAIRETLGGLYEPAERAYLYNEPGWALAIPPATLAELPYERRRAFRFVMGHFLYGAHRALPRPPVYATMVRQPLERVVSLFYHHRQHGTTDSPNLDDYVFGRRTLEADNQMIRLIVGVPRVPFAQVTPLMYDVAMDHIETRFGALMVHEQMAASMAGLSDLIGRDIPLPGKVNVTVGRVPVGDVPVRLQERILDLNRFDVQLYEAAAARIGVHEPGA